MLMMIPLDERLLDGRRLMFSYLYGLIAIFPNSPQNPPMLIKLADESGDIAQLSCITHDIALDTSVEDGGVTSTVKV